MSDGPGGGKRAEGKARTRAAILAGATTVFAERGYGRAALEEIARVSGVAVGSVYAHFGSKQDLFLAILEDNLDAGMRRALTTLTEDPDGSGTPWERVAPVVAEAHDPLVALIDTEAWAYAVRHDDDLAVRLVSHYRSVVARVEAVIGEHRRRDTPSPFDDRELALVVVATLDGLHRRQAVDSDGMSDELIIRVLGLLTGNLDSPPTVTGNTAIVPQ